MNTQASIVNTEGNRSSAIELSFDHGRLNAALGNPTMSPACYLMNNDHRFHTVNSTNIKYLRTLLGWTQAELGRRSGYSERLIRKAESGGLLKLSTIQDIAEAMTKGGVPISVHQLTLNYLNVVRKFIDAFDSNGIEAVEHCKELLTDDIELQCPADPAKVPFAGTWQCIEGLKKFLELYFGTFTRRAGSLIPTYFTSGESVIARFDDTLYYQGHPLPAVRFNLHFGFRGGLINRIDYEFNHHQAYQELEQLRNRLKQ